MTNTQHTPGPWTVNEIGGTDARTQFLGPDGALNFEVWDAITDADAHLIAAAPDLLAALESAFVAFGKAGGNTLSGPFRREWEECRSAIAKARGLS